MKLKIRNAIKDGFTALKNNPVIILVGLAYIAVAKLLEPQLKPALGSGAFSFSEFIFSYGGLNLLAIILLSVFINGVIIVLAAKGNKLSLMSAISLVASKYAALLLSSILVFIITALGLVALVLPGIFLSIKLLYYEQAVLLNNKGAVEALRTSWNTTKGNWWRVFGLALSLALISLVILMPVSFLSDIIADFIAGIFVVPFVAAAYTKSYLQLKR